MGTMIPMMVSKMATTTSQVKQQRGYDGKAES